MSGATTDLIFLSLGRRFRAAIIDGALIVLLLSVLLLPVANLLADYGPAVRIGLLFLPVFLIDPYLVASTGGTIGHHAMQLRVQKVGEGANIGLGAAILRFLTKMVFGLPSFAFVLATRQRQALHDMLAKSIVVYKDGYVARDFYGLNVPDPSYAYPSPFRRIVIIVLYALVSTLALSIGLGLFVDSACLEQQHLCTLSQALMIGGTNIFWLVLIFWLIARGWRGRLLGCRRTLLAQAEFAGP
jgi:uncharacterized RDD family membrane protein YckC